MPHMHSNLYMAVCIGACILCLFTFELNTIHSHMNEMNATQVSRNHFLFILFIFLSVLCVDKRPSLLAY